MILDTKDNVYVTWKGVYGVEEVKVYNSDGSVKYNGMVGSDAIDNLIIATDKLGNIYISGIKYFDAANGGRVRRNFITKYLQLVKK